MAYATVKKIGVSTVLELSTELERELHLTEGSEIEMEAASETLKVRPRRYSLQELLAQTDYSQPMTQEEREWIDAPRVGGELM